MKTFIPLLVALLPIGCYAQDSHEETPQTAAVAIPEEAPSVLAAPVEISASMEEPSQPAADLAPVLDKNWYFEVKPGYLLFTDKDMRHFFDRGGFAFRAETGYRFWGPFMVWVDGGYFQKKGYAIGGSEKIDLKIATITLGLKAIYYFNKRVAMYAGAGPRLFMLMMHNHSPFVRGDDNEIGIGGGFDGGFWFFPTPRAPNLFLDLFADYSWKKMKIEPDEISSLDSDVNLGSLTVGLGLGVRF